MKWLGKNTILGLALALWPAMALAQLQNPLTGGGGGVDPNELFARVAGGFIFLIGGVALFFVVLGGYAILTAAGNSERYAQGKKTIAWALIGLIVVVGSYVLLSTALDVATGWKGLAPFDRYMLTDPLGLIKLNGLGGAVFYGGRLTRFFVSGLGALAVLMFVFGGLQWVMAAGNQEKITKARQTIAYAIMGVAIVMSSYILINFIYTPLYNLFSSGQAPQTQLTVSPAEQDTRLAACFRRLVGQDFGATCDLETVSDCFKPVDAFQRGQANAAYTNCNQVGACIQIGVGTGLKNQVAATACQPGNPSSMKLFNPFSHALPGSSCPFDGTMTLYTGNQSGGQYLQECYTDVQFLPGQDAPLRNTWACIRTMLDGFRRPKGYECDDTLTQAQCNKWNDPTHLYPTFYYGRTCADTTDQGVTYQGIGYCQQNWAGHSLCKNGVVKDQCTPPLFSSVGVPVPPGGCGYYLEIAGQCYVPLNQPGGPFTLYKDSPNKICS